MTGKDRCLLGILMTVAVVVSVDDSIAINSRSFHRKDVLATPYMEKMGGAALCLVRRGSRAKNKLIHSLTLVSRQLVLFSIPTGSPKYNSFLLNQLQTTRSGPTAPCQNFRVRRIET